MKFESRWYQQESSDALLEALSDPDCKPVVAIPTGAGKTVILSLFIQKYLKENPHDEVLVLSHTQRIVSQDIAALESFFPEEEIACYSAGLHRKEHAQITVGGIQSVIKNPDLFKWTNLVIVDEVHKVSHKNEGSYRKLLGGMSARLTGLSATIFRTGHGYIHEGKGVLFNKLVYDLTSVVNYNRLVKEGYLAKMISVAPKTQLDSADVKKIAGEYNIKALSQAHDQESITKAALKEALYYGKNYKKWLVFAIDIDHAEHIADELNSLGISASSYHSRTKTDGVLESFTEGKLRALVSVEKITTGFDSPQVDLIIMLRPTLSAVLHVQMAGRGCRPYTGKDHCLFLDYAGNTERLGPINDVVVPDKKGDSGDGEAPVKTCPKCGTYTHTVAKFCDSCGHEFVFATKLELSSSAKDIVAAGQGKTQQWYNVTSVTYAIHKKPGSPDSLMATYWCGLKQYKEWFCVNHPGAAGHLGRHKLTYRGFPPQGLSIAKIYENRDLIEKPKRILVDTSKKYPIIENIQL